MVYKRGGLGPAVSRHTRTYTKRNQELYLTMSFAHDQYNGMPTPQRPQPTPTAIQQKQVSKKNQTHAHAVVGFDWHIHRTS